MASSLRSTQSITQLSHEAEQVPKLLTVLSTSDNMHNHVKDSWIQALRSGRYLQGHHALNWNNEYCCLGVLCDLHSKQTGTDWEVNPDCKVEFTYMSAPGLLPAEVAEWAGLKEDSLVPVKVGHMTHFDISLPLPHFGKSEARVSELNDGGNSFEEIADLVEEYLSVNKEVENV